MTIFTGCCPALSREVVGRGEVAIQELRADGGADSDTESSGSDANDAIAAAGMQIAQMHTQHNQFIAAVNNLVGARLASLHLEVLHPPWLRCSGC